MFLGSLKQQDPSSWNALLGFAVKMFLRMISIPCSWLPKLSHRNFFQNWMLAYCFFPDIHSVKNGLIHLALGTRKHSSKLWTRAITVHGPWRGLFVFLFSLVCFPFIIVPLLTISFVIHLKFCAKGTSSRQGGGIMCCYFNIFYQGQLERLKSPQWWSKELLWIYCINYSQLK